MSLIHEQPVKAIWPLALALLPSLGVLVGGGNSEFGNGAMCVAASLLLAAMLYRWAPPLRFWRHAWPTLALIAAAALWAAVGLGTDRAIAPDLGASALVGFAGCAAALLCGAVLGARRAPLARFIDLLLLFGCATLVIALAAMNGPVLGISATIDDANRFLGAIGNANATGALCAALAMLALARTIAVRRAPRIKRGSARESLRVVPYLMALLLLLGGCVLTASRSAIVIVVAGLTAVALRAAIESHGRRVLLFLVLGVGLILAILMLGYGETATDRFGGLPRETGVRTLMWSHFWEVAQRSLLFGYGIGSFAEVNLRFADDVRAAQALWMVNSPHNILLRLMLDGGIPFAVLVLAAAATIALRIGRVAWIRSLDLHETAIALAWAGILASALVDIALEVPAVAMLAMNFAGLLWGRALGSHQIAIAAPALDPPQAEHPVAG